MFFNGLTILVILVLTYSHHSMGESYNVAVMEFEKKFDISGDNGLKYINLIDEITANQSQALDLIIFPESTLTPTYGFLNTASQIPNNSDIVLCNSTNENYSKFLKDLSCAAVRHNTTIIINFTEKEVCENAVGCLGDTFYNTDVALGSNGTIIARYRKMNLFGEIGKSKPKTLDLPVLKMKNTTFGMMTCFDILFGVPGINLTKHIGVQNVIYPSNWFSELPYLTALQVQQMWAQEMNVVLLASGASLPTAGSGGSGIFYGSQGPLVSDVLAKSGTKVMIQEVPSDMQQKLNISLEDNSLEYIDRLATAMDDFKLIVDPTIAEHNSVIVDTNKTQINATICHGEPNNILCCKFKVSYSVDQKLTSDSSDIYTYHLVAFNGVRTYSNFYYGGVETCGIVACLNDSLNSCGQRFKNYSNTKWPLTFNSISIEGSFVESDQRVQYPTTLMSSIRPLPVKDYTWSKDVVGSSVSRRLSLEKPQQRLLTFGIFGRDFERDWDPIRNDTDTNNFATTVHLSESCTFILMTLMLLIFVK